MKHIAAILAVFTLSITSAMAEKGFDLTREITINVSADELWEMVGPGFTDVYKWASNVDHSEGAGTAEFSGATCSERTCDVAVKGFNKIQEKLVKYSDDQMNLAYSVHEGMPGFITEATNDWTVVPVSDTQCKLVMKAKFRTKGLMGSLMTGNMEKKMNTLLGTVLNDAKVYAETGNPSEEKLARIAQLDKKSKKAA